MAEVVPPDVGGGAPGCDKLGRESSMREGGWTMLRLSLYSLPVRLGIS